MSGIGFESLSIDEKKNREYPSILMGIKGYFSKVRLFHYNGERNHG